MGRHLALAQVVDVGACSPNAHRAGAAGVQAGLVVREAGVLES